MPRIRTIKPEFCTSDQVVECSTTARLLFVCMWMFCDDAGRHPDNPKRLKMEVFPGDPFTDAQVRSLISELVKARLLVRYKHDGQCFLQVTGWSKHQKIDRPSYKYPPLRVDGTPACIEEFDEHSSNGSGTFDDRSPPEGNGRESKGMEGNGRDVCGVAERAATPPTTEFSFIVANGSQWFLPESKHQEYRGSFPILELDVEYRKAAQWLRDNPKRRKTARGMPAFLGSWLTRAQDRGGARIEKTESRVFTDYDNYSATGGQYE